MASEKVNAEQFACPKCGADLLTVGVTVSARETLLYMAEMGAPGLRRIASIGTREIGDVRCRRCVSVIPVKCVEALHIG